MNLRPGAFYRDGDGTVWCCFDVDPTAPAQRQARCVKKREDEKIISGTSEFFFADGRYTASGLCPEADLTEECGPDGRPLATIVIDSVATLAAAWEQAKALCEAEGADFDVFVEEAAKRVNAWRAHGTTSGRTLAAAPNTTAVPRAEPPEPKSLTALRDEAFRIAREHGFKDASVGEDLMLMVTELSEAMEDHRAGKLPHELKFQCTTGPEGPIFDTPDEAPEWMRRKGLKPIGIPSEIADVIIRALHFSGKHGIDIERAVLEKMAYNESRPFKHGKKL